MEDNRFVSNELRRTYRQELNAIIEPVLGKYTSKEILSKLEELQIPCAPLLTLPEAFEDPQIVFQQILADIEDPVVGKVKVCKNPIKFSGEMPEFRSPAPMLGQHTRELLEQKGYADDYIEKLFKEKIIG